MSMMVPFTNVATATLPVTAASANVALPTLPPTDRPRNLQVACAAGASVAFIKFGTSSGVTAAVTDYPVLPGTEKMLTLPQGMTHVAAICGGAGRRRFISRPGKAASDDIAESVAAKA